MFGSKNDFFTQDQLILDKKRKQLQFLIEEVWNRPTDVVAFYLSAFDFFTSNPSRFDGATIVKDLNTIQGLDMHAMIHDYIYINYKVSSNIVAKYKADLIYALEMERMGGSAYSTWSRFIGLTTFGFLFYLYKKATNKKMTNEMIKDFEEVWKLFR